MILEDKFLDSSIENISKGNCGANAMEFSGIDALGSWNDFSWGESGEGEWDGDAGWC